MTLKEKMKLIATTKCEKEGCSFLNQKLSDIEIDLLQNETYKFAIEFAEWVMNNCDEFSKQDQNLILRVFKKEKGYE
jgi:hypothetical protein